MKSTPFLVIAGELSGEEHLETILPDLKKYRPDLSYFGVGGDYFQKEGGEILYHLRSFSTMGFSELFKKILFYKDALQNIEDEVVKRGCRHALLIDFQGFNLRLAQKLKKKGVQVFYFVAPQAWAWRPHRVRALAQSVDTLYCLLPFEEEWFKERGVKRVKWVKHPLIKKWSSLIQKKIISSQPKNLILLPGSREFEVKTMLPIFFQAARNLKSEFGLQVSLVKVPHLPAKLYSEAGGIVDKVYDSSQIGEALLHSDVALATSGTVTLLTALFQVPTVIAYKVNSFNEWMFHSFVKYKGNISLANLFWEKPHFPELRQQEVNRFSMSYYLRLWFSSPSLWQSVAQEGRKLIENSAQAHEDVALDIIERMMENNQKPQL